LIRASDLLLISDNQSSRLREFKEIVAKLAIEVNKFETLRDKIDSITIDQYGMDKKLNDRIAELEKAFHFMKSRQDM